MQIQYIASGTGAAGRPLSEKIGDYTNVVDYGAVGDGVTDNTDALLRAYDAGRLNIYFPPGIFVLGKVGLIGAGGFKIVGSGRLNTTIKASTSVGPGEAMFFNQSVVGGTSAFTVFEDISFDLSGRECGAIDLDRCNNVSVNRCHFRGGQDLQGAAGVGVRLRATTDQGSYTNAISQCSFQALRIGVEFGTGGNSCSIFGGEFIHCITGVDAAPSGELDTPRIFGARFEGGGIGIKDGARLGSYFGCRFEDHQTHDILLTEGSERPLVVGGSTATTVNSLGGIANSNSPIILAPDMGRYDLEEAGQFKFFGGPQVNFRGSTAPPDPNQFPTIEFPVYFYDGPLLRNWVGLDGANAAGDSAIQIAHVNPDDEVEILGFERTTQTYGVINIGGGASVRPVTNGTTDLGSIGRQWKDVRIANALYVSGVAVVGAQAPAIADADESTAVAQINAVIAALRSHGLIASS